MRFLRWFLFYSILLGISFVIFILYILGTTYYIINEEDKSNPCEMTYMFEYFKYVRIMMDENIENQFPNYGLYAYGEGEMIGKLRKMKFNGIPVLFIPGNAGSHEQARSLASVSLRKSIKDENKFHFDFFSVSLGEDYSALYGGILMDETIYVSYCIQKILSLYKGKMNNVVLIGHSMGGIIAKGALLSPYLDPGVGNILITLATPHRPALVFDKTFADFYDDIKNRSSLLNKSGITIVSIGGGHSDTLVTSAQTIDEFANISTLSTSIPGVWISTDHLCILWCKQLVKVIVRSLFDCVDTTKKPPTISTDAQRNVETFNYHLIDRYGGKKKRMCKEKLTFEATDGWFEVIDQQFTWSQSRIVNKKADKTKYRNVHLMIPLSHHLDNITIDTIALANVDWLFACTASSVSGNSRKCDWGWNLSNRTKLSPDINYKLRRTVDLSLSEVKNLKATHILIKMDNINDFVTVNVDIYSKSSRIRNIQDVGFPYNYFSQKTEKASNIFKFDKGSIRHYLNLTNIPDAVTVELLNTDCSGDNSDCSATVELIESWNPTITQLNYFGKKNKEPKTFKIQREILQGNNFGHLRLTLNPACSYVFKVQRARMVERMSMIVRDRWPIIYPISVALLLLTISLKIDSDRLSTIGITVFITYAAMSIHLECLVAVFLLHIMAFAVCCSIIFLGSVAHKIASRFLTRAITFSVTFSDWLIGGINQVPICTMVLILSIIPATCTSLAMLISVFVSFLKLTHMYDDYLEELLMSTMRHFKILKPKKEEEVNEDTRHKILNNLIVFMLICFAALPAVPSVLVWAKNFEVSKKLTSEDPLLVYSLIIIIICSMLDFIQIPTTITLRTQLLGYILCVISWVILYLASIQNIVYHQWLMPPFIAGSIILISLNSLIQ